MSSGGISFAAFPFLNFESTDFISVSSGGLILMSQLAEIARSDSMNSGGFEIRDSGVFLVVSHVKWFWKCLRSRLTSQPELGTSESASCFMRLNVCSIFLASARLFIANASSA